MQTPSKSEIRSKMWMVYPTWVNNGTYCIQIKDREYKVRDVVARCFGEYDRPIQGYCTPEIRNYLTSIGFTVYRKSNA